MYLLFQIPAHRTAGGSSSVNKCEMISFDQNIINQTKINNINPKLGIYNLPEFPDYLQLFVIFRVQEY